MKQTSFAFAPAASGPDAKALAPPTKVVAQQSANVPPKPTQVPSSAEIATVVRGEFLQPLTLNWYPNLSSIIRNRANGQGIMFYDTMLVSDPDLNGLAKDMMDDVLKSPYMWEPGDSTNPLFVEQAQFCEDIFEGIRYKQSWLRHMLWSYLKGYSVSEKMYEVRTRGRWIGAVAYSDILDKPSRWFAFDLDRQLRFINIDDIFPGTLVPQQKFVVSTFGTTSDPWGRPVLDDIYWAWFLKHHLMKQRAIFMEKWAAPTLLMVYKWAQGDDTINKEQVAAAIEAGAAIQTQQVIAMPEGITATLLESARNGSISFDQAVDSLTAMESRCLTGQVLSSMGDKGGSYALGKVHEKRESNKVDMLGDYVGEQVSWTFRELVIRNWGEQERYPRFRMLTKDPAERQAEAEADSALQKNGVPLSKSFAIKRYQAIPPKDQDDLLTPSPTLAAGATSQISPGLADRSKAETLAHVPKELYRKAASVAARAQKHQAKISSDALTGASSAISSTVKAIAARIRTAPSLKNVSRTHMIKAVAGTANVKRMATVFHKMLDRPEAATELMAGSGDTGSTAAQIAAALEVIAIIDAVEKARGSAADMNMDPASFADSLTNSNGEDIAETAKSSFNSVHYTDIASLATIDLLQKLADPSYRALFPYVMIVATNPAARKSHKVLDGYVMSSEQALTSPDLPPFDFGCDCQAVPISAAQARAAGLTGAMPTGTIEQFAASNGASPLEPVGNASGFEPAGVGVHLDVQIQALRDQAEAIRLSDPAAWAALHSMLLGIFGYDILREDPPEEAANVQ